MINPSTRLIANICRSALLAAFLAFHPAALLAGNGETVAQKSRKLSHKDISTRARAAGEIISLDAAAGTPAVIDALRRERAPEAKRQMINALGRSGRAEARAEIRPYLTDQDKELRFQAACALSQLGSSEGLALLAATALDVRVERGHRSYAVRSMGYVATDDAANLLEPLLTDNDPSIRLQAVAALDRIGTPRAKGFIKRLSADASSEVRGLVKQISERKPMK